MDAIDRTDGQLDAVKDEAGIARNQRAGFADQVKSAVFWRSGSQIVAQLVMWASTFLVIRLLHPADYGLFAMTQVVLVFLNLLNGWGFASALVQSESIDRQRVRQVFGLLLLLNGGLGLVQFVAAPLVADYYRQPMVAELLRVQAILYLSTPFVALANALLSRRMDFKSEAMVSLAAATLSAATALACAWNGWGVWTLVAAPVVYWWTRAIGLTVAARSLVRPSFRFAGAGKLIGFGGAMVLAQFCWFLQSQADVFIGGRMLSPHQLGIYTTALFLTQILAAKFVPPLNDVAFAAYSRIQSDAEIVQSAFLKAVRLIMLVALPFYFGLAATAEPLVLTVLGEQWAETIALVPILAFAMPFMTLQILFAPATNALGRPRIAVHAGLVGAVILPIAFLIGIGWGPQGLAYAWLVGMALLAGATVLMSLPTIGVDHGALGTAILPGLACSAAMGLIVVMLDANLPAMPAAARLVTLVTAGIAAYGALLFLFARPIVEEVLALIRRADPAPSPQAL